jgi:hypothetical protein
MSVGVTKDYKLQTFPLFFSRPVFKQDAFCEQNEAVEAN